MSFSKTLEGNSLREWSRRRDLNPRPTDYKSVALPLSYTGLGGAGDGNRTHVIGLEGRRSAIELRPQKVL